MHVKYVASQKCATKCVSKKTCKMRVTRSAFPKFVPGVSRTL